MLTEHYCKGCQNKLCIRKVPIFSTLNNDNLLQIMPLIQHKSYQKGEILVSDGDKTDSIVIINKGSVKAYKYTPDGREQILYVFSEGDFFGEQYLLNTKVATYSIEALEDVKVCMLTKEKFQSILNTYPDISLKIINELGKRITRLENALQSMGVRNIDSRIAMLLVEYYEKYGEAGSDGHFIHLPLSREGLANYLGIARETISRKLNQLEDDGIIISINNKTLAVKDMESLQSMAGIS